MTNSNCDILTTQYKPVRCTCSSGHIFLDRIPCSIDIAEDAEALVELSSWGMPVTTCEICRKECPTAEAVLLHDPRRRRLALFIPNVISHREALLRAHTMSTLAQLSPEEVGAYCLDFDTLVGVGALTAWQYELSEEAQRRQVPEGSEGSLSTKPPIHEAFADLIRPERRFTSAPPPPEPASGVSASPARPDREPSVRFDLTIDPDDTPPDDE